MTRKGRFDLKFIQERKSLFAWLKKPIVKPTITSTTRLSSYFKRQLPDDEKYKARLQEELDLIAANNFDPIFVQVMEILQHTKGIQHIVRGSAAGSLVSWMLGITHLDPIKHEMCLARFMNVKRINKPDIDLDFPQHLRDSIIDIIFQLYPNRVGRVCNHVNWRVNSAYNEAMRQSKGYYHKKTQQIADKLNGTLRYDSTHCGGVVIFDNDVPKKYIGSDDKLRLDKRQVESEGLVKIDILSNRGLSLLHELDPHRPIEDYPFDDPKIVELLDKADLVGVTYSETPVVIRIVRYIKPKNPIELSLCLALIRPAPDKKAVLDRMLNGEKNLLVYDDDVIEYISEMLDCDTAEGEKVRKQLIKGVGWEDFEEKLKAKVPTQTAQRIVRNVAHIDKYSFCKSHAYSYGYLCWALLWHKAHNNLAFWKAVLLHGRSQYEDWVYLRQSIRDGHRLELYDKGTRVRNKQTQMKLSSFFKIKETTDAQKYKQFKEMGIWDGSWMSDCGVEPIFNNVMQQPKFRYKGLLACSRQYNVQDGIITFATIGTGDGQYWNVTMDITLPKQTKVLEGEAILGKQPYELYASLVIVS